MNPLTPIERGLEWALARLHDDFTLTYGWSIVVVVLLVRIALLPLMVKQYRSMRRMQVVAPQLKELQQKYKGDRAKQQEEMMRFYQENNINPFASCAPMLVQIPIFLALYYVLRDFARGAHDGTTLGFMGVIEDITKNVSELGLVATVIIALVYGGSQLLSSELSFEPHTPDSQRRLMRILPIVVVVGAFQFPFPAGLAIYWVTSNLFTAAQQLIIRHKIEHDMEENPEEFTTSTKRSSRSPRAVTAPAVEGASASALEGSAAEASSASGATSGSRSGSRTPPRRSGGQRSGGSGSGKRRAPKKRR